MRMLISRSWENHAWMSRPRTAGKRRSGSIAAFTFGSMVFPSSGRFYRSQAILDDPGPDPVATFAVQVHKSDERRRNERGASLRQRVLVRIVLDHPRGIEPSADRVIEEFCERLPRLWGSEISRDIEGSDAQRNAPIVGFGPNLLSRLQEGVAEEDWNLELRKVPSEISESKQEVRPCCDDRKRVDVEARDVPDRGLGHGAHVDLAVDALLPHSADKGDQEGSRPTRGIEISLVEVSVALSAIEKE